MKKVLSIIMTGVMAVGITLASLPLTTDIASAGTLQVWDQDSVNRSFVAFSIKHAPYIDGYADGSFKPENQVTRAEAIAMLVKNTAKAPKQNATYAFPESGYTDVSKEDWYYCYVGYMYKYHILKADNTTTFEGGKAITRGEFAQIASRFTKYIPSNRNIFSDVSTTNTYSEAICAVYDAGWISGYPDGTFRPNATITRAETVKIINKMSGRTTLTPFSYSYTMKTFWDVPADHWAYGAIGEASTVHQFNGSGDNEQWL